MCKMKYRAKTGIKLKISCFDTIINYRMFQKLMLLGNGELNHLTTILTTTILQIIWIKGKNHIITLAWWIKYNVVIISLRFLLILLSKKIFSYLSKNNHIPFLIYKESWVRLESNVSPLLPLFFFLFFGNWNHSNISISSILNRPQLMRIRLCISNVHKCVKI